MDEPTALFDKHNRWLSVPLYLSQENQKAFEHCPTDPVLGLDNGLTRRDFLQNRDGAGKIFPA
jgi:hypothetical protein